MQPSHLRLPVPPASASGCRRSPASEGCHRTAPIEASSLLRDRKSTRLNSSHLGISYAVFCLKKKQTKEVPTQPPDASSVPSRLSCPALALVAPCSTCAPRSGSAPATLFPQAVHTLFFTSPSPTAVCSFPGPSVVLT